MNGTTIFVVRHGATKMNNQTDLSEDRIRGWANVPLSDEGRQEAHKAAAELQKFGIQVVETSDLVRASETAQIIGQAIGVQPQPNPKLRPWNLGDFTGQSTKDALPKIAEYATSRQDEPVPGGESFNQFKERALQGVGEAIQRAGGRPLCIVTHHRDERLLRAWEAMGEPPSHEIDLGTFLQKGDPPGGVFEMQINPAALAPAGGAPQPGMPPGGPAQPGGAQLPVPAGGQPPQPGMPPGGQPPQANPMFAMLAKFKKIHDAVDLLRQDIPRGYRIDIEVDTMVAGDQMQERQDATEFLKATTEFIMGAGQIVMQNPEFAPLAGKMLQWGVRKFRVGRELEASIDEYVDELTKKLKAQAGQPKPPSPDQIKAQTEQKRSEAEITSINLKAKSEQANDQREAQLKQLEFALKKQQHDMDAQMMQLKMRHETEMSNMKMQLEQMRVAGEVKRAQLQDQASAADHQRGQEAAAAQHQRDREFADHQHKTRMANGAAAGAVQ